MPFPFDRCAIWTWLVWGCVWVLFICAGPAASQQGVSRNWRIGYHESLPQLVLEGPASPERRTDRADRAPLMRASFDALGRTFDLELESNARLVADLGPIGRVTMAPDMRLFRGAIAGKEGSWLRLAEQDGVWSGAIWDGVELYLVDSEYEVARSMDIAPDSAPGRDASVIYRLSDTEDMAPVHCGLDDETQDPMLSADGFGGLLTQFAPSFAPSVASATTEEALKLVVVADEQFVAQNGENTTMAVISRVNVVDGIFDSQIGVALALVDIVALSSNGSLTSTDAGDLLMELANLSFSGEIENPGLVHLFTGRNLDGATAGIAFLESVCRSFSGVGLSEMRGVGTRGAITVAHEIGHNFGAPHDNQTGSACAATPSGFIMNPSLNSGGDTFSQCSVEQVAPVVSQAQCLVPVPEPGMASASRWTVGVVALLWMRGIGCRRRKAPPKA